MEVSKSQFKARALEYFRQVEKSGESMIITDHGHPSVEVRPYKDNQNSPLEKLKGSVVEYIDPEEPVGENEWDALK